jgi:ribonucleoside-diphosphate reductase alpha chain
MAQPAAPDSVYANFKTIRRNGSVVAFEPGKISVAMSKAFLAVAGSQGATSARIRDQVANLTEQVVSALMRRKPEGGAIHIEEIQDQVELALMRSGEHDVARAYVLYREERSRQRALRGEADVAHVINVVKANGERQLLDVAALKALIKSACAGLEADTDAEHILSETLKNLYDGVAEDEVNKSAIMAARAMIEKDPSYNLVTSRLLLNSIRLEILGEAVSQEDMAERYAEYFPGYIKRGVAAELLDEKLGEFDTGRGSRRLL